MRVWFAALRPLQWCGSSGVLRSRIEQPVFSEFAVKDGVVNLRSGMPAIIFEVLPYSCNEVVYFWQYFKLTVLHTSLGTVRLELLKLTPSCW